MQRIEQFFIPGELNRAGDIVLPRRGSEFPETGVLQDRQAQPRAISPPAARHNRHSHIERIAGRATADIRIRIKRDIHIEVALQIVARRALELDAAAVDTVRPQPLLYEPPPARSGGDEILEQQAATGNCLQDLAPGIYHIIGDFLVTIKYPPSDIAVFPPWRSGSAGQRLIPDVAELAPQPHRLLIQAVPVRQIRPGSRAAVREESIHCLHARRMNIPDSRKLDGSRTVHQYRQA